MSLPAQALKVQLIDKVAALLQARVPEAGRARLMERFIRRFYAHAAPADVIAAGPELLYGAALAIWQFAADRPPDTAKVRLYSPQIDRHGWQSGHTVVEVVNDDMPFLVDSVTAALNERGLAVHWVIHPVFLVRRDSTGRLIDLADDDDATDPGVRRESLMHVAIARQTGPERLDDARHAVLAVLAEVRAAVEDWQPMRTRVREIAADLEEHAGTNGADSIAEAAAFLKWLDQGHFTFLGTRCYRFAAPVAAGGATDAAYAGIGPDGGLGVLRDQAVVLFDGLRDSASLPPEVRWFIGQPDLLRVTKTNRRSSVHRPVPMDAIFVKAFDAEGRLVGDHLLVGLFTSTAYNRLPREIPYLRKKVARIIDRAGFHAHGHDAKALLHILEGLPRDELFQAGDEALFDTSLGILHLKDRQRLALFARRDPFERQVSCLLFVPRERYDTNMRVRLQGILEQSFAGTTAAFAIQVGEGPFARLHFQFQITPGSLPVIDVPAIEARLAEAARAWIDLLHDALLEQQGEEAGLRLFGRYGAGFPTAYTERFSAEAAVFDLHRIEEAETGGRLVVSLSRPLEATPHELRFRIYSRGQPVPLSDVLPVLEHLDLNVITEQPFEIRPSDRPHPIWLHDFVTCTRPDVVIDAADIQERFQDAFSRVWYGEMEDDGFNRLVVRAGLTWRQVTVLRALAKYLRQATFPFSHDYMADTLARQPRIARLIVDLFHARFDPAPPPGRAPVERLVAALTQAIETVQSLDEDRILRRFINLIEAMVRTNAFQTGADGQPKPYLACKFNSQAIDDLPLPRPLFEIFVYSPRVEAIHLRGGKVARGGIRWSDRREDFRTEVLGLMKAQMVKNAVIVPVGSKGGFVLKRPPEGGGREALLAEGIACYKTMMAGLLDLTDNLGADGTVVAPRDLVRLDDDDPYLVVAADKGTASFSDLANTVARTYGFWLDDAFASGGSAGYDHKGMGITARGAWESVKRHFRELGVDIQNQPFTCVGIGDMAGDVFGNGMLLSRQIRLIAAFNHQHIFCDPDPEPAASFAERRRLFALPRSSWADYDPAKLSPGGAVFDRGAKSLLLSPELRARLRISRERITPAGLIQALLRAEVDLLYFGGIGTFVKAKTETALEVGDKANDAVRIDGAELRARVVAEGANLGMTQRGRIEAARAGVRLNTDAIDNAAGVDCSDHEVNLKILLGDVVARGDLTVKQRDQHLAVLTEDVAALVLSDNYLQTQALSVAEAAGAGGLESQVQLLRALEKAGRLNRAVEFLPDDEALAERAAAKQGLTRPELAILLAYAKIALKEDLLASTVPDDPLMAEDLARYFPKPLRRTFAEPIARHRLRREIIATFVTNSLINRAGPTFVRDMMERSGLAAPEVVRAYAVVRDAFDLRSGWTAIEALDTLVPARCQIGMIQEIVRLLERAVAWLLAQGPHPLDIAGEIAAYRPCVESLYRCLEVVIGPEAYAGCHHKALALMGEGVPEALAQRIAALPVLAQAMDVAQIARLSGRAVPAVAAVYFSLGYRFGIEWLRDRAQRLSLDTPWQKQAVSAIVDDLFAHQSQITAAVLSHDTAGADAETAINTWIDERRISADRVSQLVTELHTLPAVDLAMLAVANRQIRGLCVG